MFMLTAPHNKAAAEQYFSLEASSRNCICVWCVLTNCWSQLQLGSLMFLSLLLSPLPLSLKPLDVEFMKAIHSKVNIVPVIAKADTLTLRERDRLKRRVSSAHTFPYISFLAPEGRNV